MDRRPPLLTKTTTRMSLTTIEPSFQAPLLGDVLSPDCRSHIFQYLSLYDCLQLTNTSRACVCVMLPELHRRRSTQFLHRHEQQNAWLKGVGRPILRPVTPIEENPIIGDSATMRYEGDSSMGQFIHPIEKVKDDQDYWCLLPSVKERLEGLYSAIPVNHPFHEDLRQLVLDLQGDEGVKTSNLGFKSSLVESLQAVTKAHRLHATMLCRCTINADPVLFTQPVYVTSTNHQSDNNLTVTLAQYFGDILSASCLMSHSYGLAGVVEGGPSLQNWVSHLELLEDGPGHLTKESKSWYQIFVYLHSALLRSAPLTLRQWQQLRTTVAGIFAYSNIRHELSSVAPMEGNEQSAIEHRQAHDSLLFPFSCFISPLDNKLTTKLLERVRCGRDNGETYFGNLLVTFNEFGPLGPAFRGRDRMSQREISYRLLSHVAAYSTTRCLHAPSSLRMAQPTWHCNQVVDFAYQCRQNRPMTVLPPLVTVQSRRLDDRIIDFMTES